MSWANMPQSDSVQLQLARELHDGVAQTLTTMLIQIENFKFEQQGRPGVIMRLSRFQDTTREVLNELRALLFALRDEPAVDSGFISRLKRTYGVPFGRRSGIKVQFRISRYWPAVIQARAAGHLLAIVGEAIACGSLRGGNRAEVDLTVAGENAQVEVRTNGRAEDGDASLTGQFHSIRQRAIMLGGTVNICGADGHMSVRVGIPLRQLVSGAR